MQTHLRWPVLFIGLLATLPAAEPAPRESAAATRTLAGEVQAVDDARVAATLAGDAAALERLLSDELRYAHSSGSVDTKSSLLDALATKRTRYLAMDYEERSFAPISSTIVMMTGRTRIKVAGAANAPADLYLSFLAIWREERGRWQFLAWQSARIPPSAASSK